MGYFGVEKARWTMIFALGSCLPEYGTRANRKSYKRHRCSAAIISQCVCCTFVLT
jgi:hypothetical protein